MMMMMLIEQQHYQRFKRVDIVTPAVSKVTVFFILLYFAESAAGSCISYGHACWGGHGKRSHSPEIELDVNALVKKNWLLFHLFNSKPVENKSHQQESYATKYSKRDDYYNADSDGDTILTTFKSNIHGRDDFLDGDEGNIFIQPRTENIKIKLYKLLRRPTSVKTN